METKEILGITAIVLSLIAFYPYIRSIFKGETKPHVFSWIVWGFTTFIVFLAQLSDGGGAGAWVTGVSGLITMYVAFLAFKRHPDITITLADKVFFVSALLAIPFWYFTSDPFWAVVILTTVDFLGFGPTVRKAYHHPYDELLKFYVIVAFRDFFALMALENYSSTTLMFPVMTGSTCVMFIIMVSYRRAAGQV